MEHLSLVSGLAVVVMYCVGLDAIKCLYLLQSVYDEQKINKSDFMLAFGKTALAVSPLGQQPFLFYLGVKFNICNLTFTIYSRFLSRRNNMVSLWDPSTFFQEQRVTLIPGVTPFIGVLAPRKNFINGISGKLEVSILLHTERPALHRKKKNN